MTNIETKYVKRRGKLVPVCIVFNGYDYTVYDTTRAKMKSKKFFSLTDIEKEFKFVEVK